MSGMEDITDIAIFVALGAAFAAGVGLLARWAKQDFVRICAYALSPSPSFTSASPSARTIRRAGRRSR